MCLGPAPNDLYILTVSTAPHLLTCKLRHRRLKWPATGLTATNKGNEDEPRQRGSCVHCS